MTPKQSKLWNSIPQDVRELLTTTLDLDTTAPTKEEIFHLSVIKRVDTLIKSFATPLQPRYSVLIYPTTVQSYPDQEIVDPRASNEVGKIRINPFRSIQKIAQDLLTEFGELTKNPKWCPF